MNKKRGMSVQPSLKRKDGQFPTLLQGQQAYALYQQTQQQQYPQQYQLTK